MPKIIINFREISFLFQRLRELWWNFRNEQTVDETPFCLFVSFLFAHTTHFWVLVREYKQISGEGKASTSGTHTSLISQRNSEHRASGLNSFLRTRLLALHCPVAIDQNQNGFRREPKIRFVFLNFLFRWDYLTFTIDSLYAGRVCHDWPLDTVDLREETTNWL